MGLYLFALSSYLISYFGPSDRLSSLFSFLLWTFNPPIFFLLFALSPVFLFSWTVWLISISSNPTSLLRVDYEPTQLSTIMLFFTMRGTVFTSPALWVEQFVILALFVGMAAAVHHFGIHDEAGSVQCLSFRFTKSSRDFLELVVGSVAHHSIFFKLVYFPHLQPRRPRKRLAVSLTRWLLGSFPQNGLNACPFERYCIDSVLVLA